MHDRVRNQFAGDQDGVITCRAKFADVAECRPHQAGSFAPAPNLQHQQLTIRL
jgi:hypothetical protein